MRLTPKMKEALERLFRCQGGVDWVAMSTAYAIEDRGLASFIPNRNAPNSSTRGLGFPEYQMTLTVTGRAWCNEHYKTLARHDVE